MSTRCLDTTTGENVQRGNVPTCNGFQRSTRISLHVLCVPVVELPCPRCPSDWNVIPELGQKHDPGQARRLACCNRS